MYTIKRTAELTGVAPPTLRAWERRYDIVSPRRTEAGYRIYDNADVETIRLMKSLVEQGRTASLAAAETRRLLAPVVQPDRERAVDPDASEAHVDRPSSVEHREFVDAAGRLDVGRIADLLDTAFARGSFEQVVDVWLLPALRDLGQAWADGRVSVASEHLASHAVLRRLAALYEAAARNTDGARVMIGLPPGARHELGALAFAIATRRAGLATAYLGADLPVADWVTAVGDHHADCAVVPVPTTRDVPALDELAADLRRAHPGLLLAVGGAVQDRATADCLRLGHRIGPAARQLARVLHDRAR